MLFIRRILANMISITTLQRRIWIPEIVSDKVNISSIFADCHKESSSTYITKKKSNARVLEMVMLAPLLFVKVYSI